MQHIKRTASSIAKQIFETKGKIFAELMSEWDVIIGINFAHKCYPKKICSVVDGENKINILYISCDDVVTSFEIEYKKLVSNYAKALFEMTKDCNEIDEISKQLTDVK